MPPVLFRARSRRSPPAPRRPSTRSSARPHTPAPRVDHPPDDDHGLLLAQKNPEPAATQHRLEKRRWVLDNLSSHKGERARRWIESRGARLEPPYSPDLNPIEMVFSTIKQLLRSMAGSTGEALWGAMQSVLDAITPTDAAHRFRHCGYTLRQEVEGL